MTAFCDALNGGKDIANRKCVHEPFYVSDRRVGLCSTNNASVRRTIASRKSLARNFFSSFPREIARHKTFSAHFLEESAATKLFRLISSGNRPPQNFSAHFLEESAATKLFRLISSGNRPPQNFFGSFPPEIGRHKLFRLISSGNRPPQNCFGSFPQEIGRSLTHSFPQEIDGWSSTHCLRKSAGCGSPPCQTHDRLRGALLRLNGAR